MSVFVVLGVLSSTAIALNSGGFVLRRSGVVPVHLDASMHIFYMPGPVLVCFVAHQASSFLRNHSISTLDYNFNKKAPFEEGALIGRIGYKSPKSK